ncbi:MAG: hypothetical protein IJE00_00385 [Clostridia bacterium]|nr:hypothetical protein [Clostridia bacterium]
MESPNELTREQLLQLEKGFRTELAVLVKPEALIPFPKELEPTVYETDAFERWRKDE